jgi:hypothetical protein
MKSDKPDGGKLDLIVLGFVFGTILLIFMVVAVAHTLH